MWLCFLQRGELSRVFSPVKIVRLPLGPTQRADQGFMVSPTFFCP